MLPGAHVYTVYAQDAAGNRSPASAPYTVTVPSPGPPASGPSKADRTRRRGSGSSRRRLPRRPHAADREGAGHGGDRAAGAAHRRTPGARAARAAGSATAGDCGAVATGCVVVAFDRARQPLRRTSLHLRTRGRRMRAVTRGTWLALGAMAISVFVIANDVTALSVALPEIEKDFDADVSTVQWVINAYALVFGVLIVTGGRLADMLGRRRLFFIGAAIFAAFSLLARRRPGRALADRLPGADGHRRGDDVARRPRDDLRHPARGPGGAGRRADHRRRPASATRPARCSAACSPRRSAGAGSCSPTCRSPRIACFVTWRSVRESRGARGGRAHRRARGRDALDRPGGAAARARPGDRLGLERPAHPRACSPPARSCSSRSRRSSAAPARARWSRAT